jgi:hypothetical protein
MIAQCRAVHPPVWISLFFRKDIETNEPIFRYVLFRRPRSTSSASIRV